MARSDSRTCVIFPGNFTNVRREGNLRDTITTFISTKSGFGALRFWSLRSEMLPELKPSVNEVTLI